MRKTKNLTIEDQNYTLIEMPALRRSVIGLQMKYIGTGASEGIKDLDTEIDYVKIVTGILERIEPEKGALLLKDIIVNGLQFPIMMSPEGVDMYDEHFGEFYHHQIDLVVEILSMNFGKSIDNIKKKLEKTGIISMMFSEENQSDLDSQKNTN